MFLCGGLFRVIHLINLSLLMIHDTDGFWTGGGGEAEKTLQIKGNVLSSNINAFDVKTAQKLFFVSEHILNI